jgi:serine/threonine-protein kinase HipA
MPISLERRDLALECGDAGRFANAANLLTQASRFLLEPGQARAIIDEMEQIVNHRWHDLARREGVSEKDCLAIRSAFAYPGFRLR